MLFRINNNLVHVLWRALRYQLFLKSLCVLQTKFVLMAEENKKQSRVKNVSIWNMLSSVAGFSRGVFLCGDVNCSKAYYEMR